MWIEGMAKCLYHCVVGVCAGKQSNFSSSSYIYIYSAYWNSSVLGNLCFNYSGNFPKEVG